MAYCAELVEVERVIRDIITRDVEGVAAEVKFRSECKERAEVFVKTSLAPTKFKRPPELYVHCKDKSCDITLHVKTSPAKAKQIEGWAREKRLFASRAPLTLRRVLPTSEIAIETHVDLDRLEAKVEELLGQFRGEFESV